METRLAVYIKHLYCFGIQTDPEVWEPETKVYVHAPSLLLHLCISVAEIQLHILVWHVYYIILSRFQWFRVYADMY